MTADEQGPDTAAAIRARLGEAWRWHLDSVATPAEVALLLDMIAAARTERDIALAAELAALDLVEDWKMDCKTVEKQRDTALANANRALTAQGQLAVRNAELAGELAEHRQRMMVTQGRIAADNLERALAAEAAVVTARRDAAFEAVAAWDEGWHAGWSFGTESTDTNPYRARASQPGDSAPGLGLATSGGYASTQTPAEDGGTDG